MGFFFEHKCSLCHPDDIEPLSLGNIIPVFVLFLLEQTGFAVSALAVPQDHQAKLGLVLQVQQFTAGEIRGENVWLLTNKMT
jgi:hypothetical protein